MTQTPTTDHSVPDAAARNGRAASLGAPIDGLLRLFDDAAHAWPDAIAIRSIDSDIRYRDLLRQSNQLAHWFLDRDIGPNHPVAICLDKSPAALVAILGILRAGAAYMPLDPNYPAERLALMLEDAAPTLILTSAPLKSKLPTTSADVIPFADLALDLAELPATAPPSTAGDDDLGYVLFTSGSTGRPKGVAMRRGPLRNLIEWQLKHSTVGPGDATLQFASLSFDVSFQEIFSTWATGGTLVLPTEVERRDPAALLRLIDRQSFRRLFVPFVMLQHVCESAQGGGTSLREIITAGEQLQITAAVRDFFADRPQCTLHNHYGPTEAHVVTALSLTGSPESWPTLPPIGRPIDNAVIYIVDNAGRQAATGQAGEIWIGGACLARDYINRPDLTAEKFKSDPFVPGGRVYLTGDLGRWNADGDIEFLGRIDQQVKIRGFRVEPGEIEAVLSGHPSVSAAAVTAREDRPGDRRLIAYYTAKGPTDNLRQYLSERLPDYMVPATFVALAALPLTPSGKVDRQALPAPTQERPLLNAPFVAARSTAEKAIAAIWEDVLQIRPIGINDPFFDLGGHSLALARVHLRLRERFATELPLAALFQYPTVAALAVAIEGQPGDDDAIAVVRPAANEPIAIIGFAGRFPGAANVDEFWDNLCNGVESITHFSDDELRTAGIPDDLIANPDYAKFRGLLSRADYFDAGFFGLPPREAELTDPQQRVFLETAWSALEHSGYVPERCCGRVGVFAGASMNTYLLHSVLARPEVAREFLRDFQAGGYPILVGNDKDYLATRVAYKLNLHGPAMSVQTGCSTSLVAVCTAVENLRAGKCDIALAGGVSITFPQVRGALYQEGAITSPDGHCRPFAADARGTVFGEGAAIVVLKRLSAAIEDRDSIYAVIKGIGLSNDGADKVSYLAPGVDGQIDAIAQAYAEADMDPTTVGFIEAHGTGTPLGDPIEVAALARVFRKSTPGTCRLGSVKANVGHLEAAAGVTGLIKATLALHHHRVPGTLHFREPNPALVLDRTPFRINAEVEDWPATQPRRAGVTSLGVGGTNAHVALEEAPSQPASNPSWPQQLFVISARSQAALTQSSENLADYFAAHPTMDVADTAFTLQAGRRIFPHRRFVVADSLLNAARQLRVPSTPRPPAAGAPKVAFAFPGQGSQYARMAVELYSAEPTFRAALDLCIELLRPHMSFDLREVLFATDDDKLNQTAVTQPALFAVEYALTQMWLGWGIEPESMFGHSIGEYTAACVAGVFSLDDACQLVAHRGVLIQACPPGVMLAVRMSETDALAMMPPGIDIAALNGPTQTVVSGSAEAITAFEQVLTDRNIQNKRLITSHAFHSALLDPAVDKFRSVVRGVELRPPKRPFISCVTGTWITEAQAIDPEYWATQLRRPVRCADALRTIAGDDIALLEVGPGSTLANLARQILPKEKLVEAAAGLSRDGDDLTAVLQALGRLWQAGVVLDWERFHALSPRRRIALPTYPFERQRYWIDPPGVSTHEAESALPTLIDQPVATELLPAVQALFAQLAGVDAAALGAETSFFEVGFDSLLLTQAAHAVQAKFGVRVAFRQLLEELNTSAALAAFLETQPRSNRAAPAALPVAPAKLEGPAGFGALVPIEKTANADWSPRQVEFLNAFIARYTTKTRQSKAHVQDHRRPHADPRTVSGFTRLWKEMVYPLVVDRSSGCRLWDIDGNEYIDLLNGFGPDFLGHSPPHVAAAVERQLRAGYEVGPTSPLAGELAHLVCELTGLDRASFVCTGSEAVQAALRAARTVTGRDKIVTFARDYHGNFDEVLLRPIASDGNRFATPSAPGIPPGAVGNVTVLDYGTPESLAVIRRLAPELAAVLVEPVQSRRPEWRPVEFLRELRTITQEAGAGLIFDEVITGFRLHPGGAQALFGIRADIATYGKIVGGGMPIGVVAGQAKWMDCFDGGWWKFGDESIPEAGRTFFAGTFVRHPLALAGGIATLNYLREQGPELQERLNARADRFVAELNSIARTNGVPLEIVNCGSLMFFRVLGNSKEASLLFYFLRERGVFILEGFPSYLNTAHTDADLALVANAFRESVAELRAHGFFAADVVELPAPATPGLLPLTEAQRELWLASQSGDDASRAFNETCTLRIIGPLDGPKLATAVQSLVDRHDALRAVFDPAGGGQEFRERLNAEVLTVDLSSYPPEEREKRLATLQEAADGVAFDLAVGPLLRTTIVKLSDNDHAVILTAHHIACDGWSYDVILHDLGRLYSGEPLDQAASFAEYARQRAGQPAPDLPWWKEKFTPAPLPVDLPTDRTRPAKRTFRGSRVIRTLGVPLSHQLREQATQLGCTSYALLLASYHALLHRLTGQTDLVVGIPTAGQALFGQNNLVGHCVHFLPVRQSVDPARTFSDFATGVKSNLLDAFDHQNFTYVSLLRALPGLEADRPLIAAGFNLDPALGELDFAGLKVTIAKNPKHFVNLELHWNVVDTGDEYVVEAEYNSDLFDASTIERWLGHYSSLIDDAVVQPPSPIGDLRLIDARERHQILVEWNETSRPIPEQTVHELFVEVTGQRADAPAVIAGASTLTYAELNQRANRLARVLIEHGVGPDVPVAVLLPRGAELIVALLATLKAGGAYLPLDAAHPASRNARLVADAQAKVVIATTTGSDAAKFGIPVVAIDGPLPDDANGLPNRNSPDDLAAVLYTSGSTGVPKGVMVTHRGIVRLLFASRYCDFGAHRTFALLAPIAFDAATFEIWGALLHGGRVAIYPETVPDIATLGAFLQSHAVDTLWLTAGLFNAVIDHDPSALRGIRQLMTGGEALSPAHVRRALAALPDTTLINGYGPTETTTFACTYRLPRELPAEWPSVPIGRPIGNTTVAVLDACGRPVPIGVVGELHIGGAGVARGYLHQPVLTAERFVASPVKEIVGPLYRTGDRVRWRMDGQLEFLGRTDRQVKIRGHRIEPGETEAVLAEIPDVAACAVVVRGVSSNAQLVAYVVSRSGERRDAALRAALSAKLPNYMVPAAFVFLDALPLTPNGKLNTAGLPDPEATAQPHERLRVLPRTDAEHDILRIWSDVLRQPELGVTDDFFEMGGHSLIAVELVAAVRDRLGHTVPLGTLYRAPTVEKFAAVIQDRLEAGSDSSLVPLQSSGSRPAMYMIAGVGGHVFAFHKFARLLGPDQPTFGVKAIGVDGTRATPDTIEEIATEYTREIVAARPHGPHILAGYSMGAVVAYEVALQLRGLGHAVPLLIAFDAAAPGYLTFPLWKRLRLHAANLLWHGGGWEYLKQRLRNLRDKVNWATGRGHRNAPELPGLEVFSQEAITQVWVALHKAYKRYRPARRFDGAIEVIRADILEDWDKFVSHDPLMGWAKWTTGSVTAHGLPVQHLDLFHEPAIFEVARYVGTAIGDV